MPAHCRLTHHYRLQLAGISVITGGSYLGGLGARGGRIRPPRAGGPTRPGGRSHRPGNGPTPDLGYSIPHESLKTATSFVSIHRAVSLIVRILCMYSVPVLTCQYIPS